jgi:hypothetical protein
LRERSGTGTQKVAGIAERKGILVGWEGSNRTMRFFLGGILNYGERKRLLAERIWRVVGE